MNSVKKDIDYLVDYLPPPPDFSSGFMAQDSHKKVFVLQKKVEEMQKKIDWLMGVQGCTTHSK